MDDVRVLFCFVLLSPLWMRLPVISSMHTQAMIFAVKWVSVVGGLTTLEFCFGDKEKLRQLQRFT